MKAGEQAAQLAAKVEGSTVTDDGQHMLLKLTMAAGVSQRLWSLEDMVRVVDEWEAGKAA